MERGPNRRFATGVGCGVVVMTRIEDCGPLPGLSVLGLKLQVAPVGSALQLSEMLAANTGDGEACTV